MDVSGSLVIRNDTNEWCWKLVDLVDMYKEVVVNAKHKIFTRRMLPQRHA